MKNIIFLFIFLLGAQFSFAGYTVKLPSEVINIIIQELMIAEFTFLEDYHLIKKLNEILDESGNKRVDFLQLIGRNKEDIINRRDRFFALTKVNKQFRNEILRIVQSDMRYGEIFFEIIDHRDKLNKKINSLYYIKGNQKLSILSKIYLVGFEDR